jgi:hypothetical protein
VQLLLQSAASPHSWNMLGHTPVVHSAVESHVQTTLLLESYEDSEGVAPVAISDALTPYPARVCIAARYRCVNHSDTRSLPLDCCVSVAHVSAVPVHTPPYVALACVLQLCC